MATFRLPIHQTIRPDANGNTYWEPASVNLNANDRFNHDVLAFTSQSAKQGGAGMFTVPKNYVGTPVIRIVWATTATSGACSWAIAYRAIANNETLDPSTDQEAPAIVTQTTDATARDRNDTSIALTAGNLAVDDLVLFNFYRDGAAGADTLAATAWLFALYFEYADV